MRLSGGNTWLVHSEEDYHQVYIALNDERTRWLAVSIIPNNYPGFNIDTIDQTEQAIAQDIMETNDGWLVRRLNIKGVKVKQPKDHSVYVDAEGEELKDE
jgi:hypothetical protein